MSTLSSTEIAEIRRSLGWSQVRLAAYIGVQPPTVSRWESGIAIPSGPSMHILLRLREEGAWRAAVEAMKTPA